MIEHFSGVADYIPIGAGNMGVGLFFTLSGFLITQLLLRGRAEYGDALGLQLKHFYIRRFFRLAPPYYLLLLILAFIGIKGMDESWPWHALYLSNVYAALGGERTNFWTLSVEEQFYLIWPLILLLTPWRFKLQAAILLVVSSFVFKAGSFLAGYHPSFFLLPYKIDLLGMGCVLAIVSNELNARSSRDYAWMSGALSRTTMWLSVGSVSLAVLIWLAFGTDGPARAFFNDILCAIAYCWLVVTCARGVEGPARVFFDSPVAQYVGRISYGLYLWHTWVKDIVEHYVGELPHLILGPVTIGGTFAICMLSWHFFEKPLIRYGRALTGPARRQRVSPATGAG